MNRSVRRPAALVVSLVAILLLAAGCSDDDSGNEVISGPAPPTITVIPSSGGDSCTDPSGDLDLPSGVSDDAPGLSGIDIVQATATVADDELKVSFVTAGPVDDAPSATYVVAQGEPLGELSFEIRMVRDGDGWTSTLITWPEESEMRTSLALTPTTDGDTLTAEVSTSGLPPIALALQFGTSATIDGARVTDDCTSLAAPS